LTQITEGKEKLKNHESVIPTEDVGGLGGEKKKHKKQFSGFLGGNIGVRDRTSSVSKKLGGKGGSAFSLVVRKKHGEFGR